MLAWVNVWRSVKISWWAKTTLAASLFAVVSLAMTELLSQWKVNVFIPLVGGVVAATLATAVKTLLVWFSKQKQMV